LVSVNIITRNCEKMASNVQLRNMPAYVLTIHHFSDTSSVVEKCRLRRLIGENIRKTTSSMALLASRKMDKISRSVCYARKRCLLPFHFQLKQHLNNAHKEQVSKSVEYLKFKNNCLTCVRLHAGGAFNQANFPSLRHPMWLHFALLK